MSSSEPSAGNDSRRLFRSFFLGGFECSTHRRKDGVRLDLIRSTRHAEWARADYSRLARHGILAARDGVAWHDAEKIPGEYDWTRVLPVVQAARDNGVQVIWDLCHYGWPDHLDIFSDEWRASFVRFASAFAALIRDETDDPPFYTPVNEISFLAWAGGDTAYFNPHATGRGDELKRQLVRATLEVIDAVRLIDPRARFLAVDPLVHVHPRDRDPQEIADAELYRAAQFQAWLMLLGDREPRLGGTEHHLDLVGINYYPHSQWLYRVPEGTVWRGDSRYRPFREMLIELHGRVHRPILLAETGTEDDERAPWLAYVCEEVRAAMGLGVPISGICLYPVVNHPGWEDDRHCYNGLWDYADDSGEREICGSLWAEIQRQQELFAAFDRQISSLTRL